MKSLGTLIVITVLASGGAAQAQHGHHGGHYGGHHSFGSHLTHSLFGHHGYGHHSYGHHSYGHGLHFGFGYSTPYYSVPTYSYRPTVRYVVPAVQPQVCEIPPVVVEPRAAPRPPQRTAPPVRIALPAPLEVPPAVPDDHDHESIPIPPAVPGLEPESAGGFVPRLESAPVRTAGFTRSAAGLQTGHSHRARPARQPLSSTGRLGATFSGAARPSLEDSSVPWVVGDDVPPPASTHVAHAAPARKPTSRVSPPVAPRPVERKPPRVVIPASMKGIGQLPATDRAQALRQRTCPVTGDLLGADGRPLKVTLGNRTVFVCCDGCQDELRTNPREFLAKKPEPVLPLFKLE